MPRPMLPRIISCSGRSWSGSTTTSLGSRLIRHRRASSVYSSSRNPWPASPGPAQPSSAVFPRGAAGGGDGATITADSKSLRLDGRLWTPVMGEFHYARYPQGEWRDELLKMKAGGIDIVASYVFWIHHEEIEGQWDWSGSRDLRRFVELAHEVGLKVIMRVGPWCHGEVRNGGLPDWIVTFSPTSWASSTKRRRSRE